MGKKKNCYNAFYFFMLDFKAKHPAYKSLQDVSEPAGEVWQSMSPEERKPFEDRAQSKKREKNRGVKLTSLGEVLNVVEVAEADEIRKQYNMKAEIEKTIKIATTAHTVQNDVFHILHINDYFFCNTNNRYYPAEIGIVAFNLKDGILDTYHKIINPSQVPLGYMYHAKQTAAESHQIEINMNGEGTDMNAIFKDILNMLNSKDKVIYPLYTTNKLIEKSENIFQAMAFDAGHKTNLINVYSVEYLFYVLRNAVSPYVVFPTASVADLEIERDTFEFTPGIACTFHNSTDVMQLCSLSIAIRIIYTICNHCCKSLSIPLIPGQHVPIDADVERQNNCKTKLETDKFSEMQSSSSACGDQFGFANDVECEIDKQYFDSDSESECQWDTIRSRKNKYSQCNSVQSQFSQDNQLSQNFSGHSGGVRRPASFSQVLTGSIGLSADFPRLGRGRGRGFF